MATGIISAKYLTDIAEAIRVKLGSQLTYTPAQMAAAIESIGGTITGTIVKSTDTNQGIITDSILSDIADAIRSKLDNQLTYTPAQMADAILSITGGGVTIVPWSTGTDAEIVAMINAAHNGEIDLQTDGGWAVGDLRTINISAFTAGGVSIASQDIRIVISSFDDYQNCGCVMQFDFRDCIFPGIRMNATSANTGGYGNSEMKTATIPTLENALPSWLKNLLIEFSCTSTTGNGSSTIVTVPNNKLALRSGREIAGSISIAGENDTQIPYYATAQNRIKPPTDTTTSSESRYYWLRSPALSYYGKKGYCDVSYNGEVGYGNAQNKELLAVFGCL